MTAVGNHHTLCRHAVKIHHQVGRPPSQCSQSYPIPQQLGQTRRTPVEFHNLPQADHELSLRSVGVWSTVPHGEYTWTGVHLDEVLIVEKPTSIDTFGKSKIFFSGCTNARLGVNLDVIIGVGIKFVKKSIEKLGLLPKHFSLFSYLPFDTICPLYIIVYDSAIPISKKMHQIIYVGKIFGKI